MFVSLGGPVSILQCHKAEDHGCFWKEYAGFKSHKVTKVQEVEWWSLLSLVGRGHWAGPGTTSSNCPYSLDKYTPACMVMHHQKLLRSLILRGREQIRLSTRWMRSSFTSTEGITGPEQSCADLPTGPIKEHSGMLEVLASPSCPDSDPASSPLPPPNLNWPKNKN